MKKYRFVELNNGRVRVEQRFLFFFWTNAYEHFLASTDHSFSTLKAAQDRLANDLKDEEARKVKKIHYE